MNYTKKTWESGRPGYETGTMYTVTAFGYGFEMVIYR